MRSPLIPVVLFASCILNAQDAREIVSRSVSHEDTNWLMVLRDYTWQERTEEREVDSDGKLRARESKTRDVIVINGRPWRRLVARNDQPLSGAEQEREHRKLEEEVAKARKNPENQLAEQKKERERERELLQEIPKAYNFTLLREEQVDGHEAWVIQAEPRSDYRPSNSRAKLLSRMHGTLWVDKQTYHWSRARVEFIEPVSFGLFLVRLNKGATASFDLKRVNGEIWLPDRLQFRGSAKVAFVKTLRADIEITYRDYRKFQSSSEILPSLESAGNR